MKHTYFSIVVPVYKTEAFVSQCLDSVLKQNYSDFDIIAVDDGSPDQCPQICDAYAAKDSRVHVIHQTNGGSFAARAAGLSWCLEHSPENAYILSLDSDDTFLPGALESLDKAIRENNTDLVFFRHDTDYFGKVRLASEKPPVFEGFPESKREFYRIVFMHAGFNGLCSKAIRKDLIAPEDLIERVHLRVSEDLLQSIPFYRKCSQPLFLADAIILYRIHSSSATNTNTLEHFINPAPAYQAVWDCMKDENAWTQSDFQEYLAYCRRLFQEPVWRIARIQTNLANKAALYNRMLENEFCQVVLSGADINQFFLWCAQKKQYLLLHCIGTVCKALGNLRRRIRNR